MNAQQSRYDDAASYPIQKEAKVDPMWAADEHERRIAIALRAAAGARNALRARE
jgi:hypothetical protein